ncbi:universal stress protein [Cellulomonas sp. C5510]|uniref:universal stress protein n=1 Tax=Cellulomonas sp. C5510 TaxID=2871170 RepID=UPI001C989345|nr:universal stress protein [Cellulomonas sp. C5510]QZN86972.1 universal stress protein [Cellulomonas sp. C5510]
MSNEVVVGVEGTVSSEGAVRWGADAAAARGAELLLVHALGDVPWDDALAEVARGVLDRAAERAREVSPSVKIRTEVEADRPARCLVRRSGSARLLVVGTRRLTPAQRVFSGSRSYEIAAAASCSVAVVPAVPVEADNRVVVGVDGSADSVAAVTAGAQEAERHGAVLQVVHAWEEPALLLAQGYVPPDLTARMREDEAAVLARATAGLADRFPDLEVERTLVKAQPATALLAAGSHARLVVVGSRGLHGVSRLLVGSTSHAVILHARRPVLVVRA